jgi:predicted thioesterase
VLASPWLIAFMERVSHRLIAEQLPEEFSSVGVLINVRHVAPTPVGSQVKVRADVTEVDGSRVTLNVQAWDHVELIGEGSHQRIVIDQERFLRRVDAKRPAAE